jgi:hypothetical protein
MGARFLEARARPTASETQLGQSGTFTRGVPGCSPAPAVHGARPAAPARAQSESPGPGPRARVLQLVLAAGPSVPHLRPD